jgi:hypothetical protein
VPASDGGGCAPGCCYNCLGVDMLDEDMDQVNVWGRRLANGSMAVVFVNAGPAKRVVHCRYDGCLGYDARTRQGWSPFLASAELHALDLVSGAALPRFRAGDGERAVSILESVHID